MKTRYIKEEYIKEIESAIPGIKVLQIKSEEGNKYSGVMYSYGGKEFQFVGLTLNNLDLEEHVMELKYSI